VFSALTADRGVYLEFADFGVATAYVNVGFGAFDDEARHILSLNWDTLIKPPRVLHMIGQSDVAVSVAEDEFRKLLGGPYPDHASHAFSLNWNFMVPYLFGKPEDLARWQGGMARPLDDAPLSFFQHLRLRRAIYAYAGAEGLIVQKLRALLEAHGIDASILGGLGWSDIILDGRLQVEQMREFIRFLVTVHELHLPIVGIPNGKLPVFQRILTLFGYVPGGAVPTAAGLRHMTFVRAKPGHLEQSRAALRAEFPSPLYRIAFIDGKSDFVVSLAEQPPAPFLGGASVPAGDDPTLLQRQERLSAINVDASLQRLETHLLLTDIDDIVVEAEACAVWPIARPAQHHDCTCATHSVNLDPVQRPFNALPIGLRQAIQNLLLLFTSALKDPTTCCDSFPAIAACEASLITLLKSLDAVVKDLPSVPMTKEQLQQLSLDDAFALLNKEMDEAERFQKRYPAGIDVHKFMAERFKYLEDWHHYAERVLSQRIVGSFEAMLGHTDRVTTYRGGVQKFLQLADGLVRDFTRLIIADAESLPFTTLYDSVHTIVSMRGGFFIRIPVRHVFTLPLGIADLWHEVGVTIFNLRYDPKDVATLAARLGIDADMLYEDLADAYGDFVVFLFGFRGNFRRFADSLMQAWLESEIPGGFGVPYEVLTRLYLVFEFAVARQIGRRKEHGLLSKSVVLYLLSSLRAFVCSRYPLYKERLSSEEQLTWLTLATRLVHDHFRHFRTRMSDFLDAAAPATKSPDLKEILEGRTIELGPDADINALFAEYAAMVNDPSYRATVKTAKQTSKKSQLFRSMAALGKSASQAYIQRFAESTT
jgi:hypothetical protein